MSLDNEILNIEMMEKWIHLGVPMFFYPMGYSASDGQFAFDQIVKYNQFPNKDIINFLLDDGIMEYIRYFLVKSFKDNNLELLKYIGDREYFKPNYDEFNYLFKSVSG